MKLKKWFPYGVILTFAAGALILNAGAEQAKVDPKLPKYQAVKGVSGSIKSVGSDTMVNLMTFWAESFKKFYPNVTVEIEGKGSGTAPTALISGSANFGPMSRELKKEEQDAFVKKFGNPAAQLGAAVDVVAIYVHKDNPIKGLSMKQLDAIFSKNRLGGYPNDIANWGQAGLTGDWVNSPIRLYGRNAASGTYGFMKEHALFKGDYKDTVKEQAGSSNVVSGVANDKSGIGYSGVGYKTADVRSVPLTAGDDTNYIEANMENAYSGDYPLSRFLLLTVNYKPGEKLDPLRLEFIKYVFSQEGQQDVIKEGYFPVTAETAKEMLEKVGIK